MEPAAWTFESTIVTPTGVTITASVVLPVSAVLPVPATGARDDLGELGEITHMAANSLLGHLKRMPTVRSLSP